MLRGVESSSTVCGSTLAASPAKPSSCLCIETTRSQKTAGNQTVTEGKGGICKQKVSCYRWNLISAAKDMSWCSYKVIFLYKYTQVTCSNILSSLKGSHSGGGGLPLAGSCHCHVFYVFTSGWRQITEDLSAYYASSLSPRTSRHPVKLA